MEHKDSVVVASNFRNYHKIIKRSIIILTSLLIAAILSYLIYRLVNNKKAVVSAVPCTSNTELLNQAAKAFSSNNLKSQQQLTSKIKSLPNYMKDPNCLYVVTHYYINDGDTQNANTYLNKLEKVYSTKQGFSSALLGSYSLSQLKSFVQSMNQEAKQTQQNGITFSSPKK